MNNVFEFDKIFLGIIDKELIYIKMIRKIMKIVAVFIMLIPMQATFAFLIFINSFVLMIEIVYFTKITFVRENGKSISIYEKMIYIPVDFADMYDIRKTELRRDNINYLVICLLVQNVSAVFFHMWSIGSLVYPVIASALIYLAGYVVIRVPKKYNRV